MENMLEKRVMFLQHFYLTLSLDIQETGEGIEAMWKVKYFKTKNCTQPLGEVGRTLLRSYMIHFLFLL